MPRLNERGHIVTTFVLMLPLFVFLLLATVEVSRLVFFKIKFQEALDRAVFLGARHMTENLNAAARGNRKVHQEFLDLQKRFREGMKPGTPEAKTEIKKTWNAQNEIFDREILPHIQNLYAESYAKASVALKKIFPDAQLRPLWRKPITIGEGRAEQLSFAEIKGVIFDPKGYRKVPKKDFEARLAFVKDVENPLRVAAEAEAETPKPLLPFFRWPHFQAAAAAQPYGGSLWGYAMEGVGRWLYRTAWIPDVGNAGSNESPQ